MTAAMERVDHALYAKRHVARRDHRQRACFGDCARIGRGQEYLSVVAFPGHDGNGSSRPWRMAICPGHAQQKYADIWGRG